MKIKIKSSGLWILLGITVILLISGCVGEKQEGWQPVQSSQEAGKEPAPQEAGQKVNETVLNETKNRNITEQQTINETKPEIKQVTATEVNETVQVKNESYPGNFSKEGWCVPTGGMKGAQNTITWVEGVVEFKGKLMCHSAYTSTDANGTLQYDVYSTRTGDEVYRVVTYPNGTIEESKTVSQPGNETQSSGKKTRKDPAKMVLELNDLSEEYNIIKDKTGVLTREEHFYSSEKLIETGWTGGYKTGFENEKIYVFNLSLDYEQYLKSGVIDENLLNAFEKNRIYLPESTVISQIDDKNRKTYSQNWIRQGRMEYYIIEETNDSLRIYEKSASGFMTRRLILNINSVYSPDKIKAVLEDSKQSISQSAAEVSGTNVGEDSMLYRKDITQDGINYTMYVLIFRKLNVYEEIRISGLTAGMEKNEILELGEIIAKKIE